MLYDTLEKLNKRGEELEQEKIERLIKIAQKGPKGNWAFMKLMNDYGFDLDYIPGYDDGEQPERIANE